MLKILIPAAAEPDKAVIAGVFAPCAKTAA